MALKGAVARRYAEAVFDIGREQNSIDRWRADIQTLNAYLGDRRLAFILSEPNITFAQKEQILRDLLAAHVQPDALGLALLLTERGLVDYMPRVAQEFEKLYDDYKHLAKATVTTAMPLDATERTELVASLQHMTGKQIELTTQVDPAILGGVIARVGDTLIDGSVRRRLALLHEQIISGALPVASK
jgi:F-type H+-transporting ATPase subunit delta